jgi:glyoxylase-like metal-dependent hydrolase (beta-lactamase superfamily II)
MAHYPAVEPDIRLEMETNLEPYGIPGRIVHTPGHTPGSVTVVLDDGRAIVGDNVMGIPGKTHYPPFANDKSGVIRAWEQYLQWGVKAVYPAHGVKVKASALEKELPVVRRRYGN